MPAVEWTLGASLLSLSSDGHRRIMCLQDGETPLHKAAGRHRLACMMSLLEAGADVKAVTIDGDTPVALARALANMWTHRLEPETAVSILLSWGACPHPSSLLVRGCPAVVAQRGRGGVTHQVGGSTRPLSPLAGGSMTPGVGISSSDMAAAAAHSAIRAASLSDDAVADAKRRIRLAPVAGRCVGACPHSTARMLRNGSTERHTLTDSVMAELPQVPDAAAWQAGQRRLDAAAAPAASQFVQGMFVSRAAVELAFACVHREAVSAAQIDAAGRSIAALEEVVKMTKTGGKCGGDGSCSSSAAGGSAATAFDKALYAAVRCVGRWGELCLEEADAADIELASALGRLKKARRSAEAAAAALSRLQPPGVT